MVYIIPVGRGMQILPVEVLNPAAYQADMRLPANTSQAWIRAVAAAMPPLIDSSDGAPDDRAPNVLSMHL